MWIIIKMQNHILNRPPNPRPFVEGCWVNESFLLKTLLVIGVSIPFFKFSKYFCFISILASARATPAKSWVLSFLASSLAYFTDIKFSDFSYSSFFILSSSCFFKSSSYLCASLDSSASAATLSEYLSRYFGSSSAISKALVAPISESSPVAELVSWCSEFPLITETSESVLEIAFPTTFCSSTSSFFLLSSSSGSIPKSLAASLAALASSSFSCSCFSSPSWTAI